MDVSKKMYVGETSGKKTWVHTLRRHVLDVISHAHATTFAIYTLWIHQLEIDHQNLQLINRRFTNIFSHFFGSYINIWGSDDHLLGLNLNWFKSYDTKL